LTTHRFTFGILVEDLSIGEFTDITHLKFIAFLSPRSCTNGSILVFQATRQFLDLLVYFGALFFAFLVLFLFLVLLVFLFFLLFSSLGSRILTNGDWLSILLLQFLVLVNLGLWFFTIVFTSTFSGLGFITCILFYLLKAAIWTPKQRENS